MTPLPQLAHEAERLRFRREWHLPVDPLRVDEQMTELIRRAPWHPLARNARAAEALPETRLPPPGTGLSECARNVLRGDLDAALRSVVEDPRAADTRARLNLALGRLDRAAAEVEIAVSQHGTTPSLLALRARLHLLLSKPGAAWRDAVDALVINPLHGTAAVVHQSAAAATGRNLVRYPLRAPARVEDGELVFVRGVSPRAQAAWTAWHRASGETDGGPPGSRRHQALLAAWRSHRGDERLDDRDEIVRRLDAWDTHGALTAYEWSAGLSRGNAAAFRTWNASGHGDLRRFWAEAIVV